LDANGSYTQVFPFVLSWVYVGDGPPEDFLAYDSQIMITGKMIRKGAVARMISASAQPSGFTNSNYILKITQGE